MHKKTKRIIGCTLVLLLAVAILGGCAEESNHSGFNNGSNEAESVTETKELDLSEEANYEDAETKLIPEITSHYGIVDGNKYINPLVGFGCVIEEGWTFSSREEITELNERTNDVLDEESDASMYDMTAISADGMANVNITIQKLGVLESTVQEKDVVEGIKNNSFEEWFGSLGFSNVEAEITTVNFVDKEHAAIRISAMGDTVPIYQCLVVYKSRNYIASVTATSFEKDKTDEILSWFDTATNIARSLDKSEEPDITKDEQSSRQYEVSPLLADQIDSFQLQIHDKVYSFPLAYSELLENGWIIKKTYASENGEISSACDKLVWHVFGELELDFYLYNPDTTIHGYQDCVVAGVTFSYNEAGAEDFIFIPGGFQIGVATKEEVLAAYREPDSIYEVNDGSAYISYQTDNVWASIRLTFDPEGILVGYKAENPIATEGYIMTEGSEEVIPDYIVPEELSDFPADAIISFDGQLYQLPAPLSEFLKNGWETDNPDMTIPGKGVQFCDLIRNGIEFHCSVYNFSEQACMLKNGLIVSLSSTDIYNRKEEFKVSGGICFSMTEEELVQILGRNNLKYEVRELSYGVTYNIIIGEPDYENYITVSFEEGKVKYIVCRHTGV